MIEIPLKAIPNQSLSIKLDDRRYEITLQTAGNVMAVTIIRDGETIAQGARCGSGMPLLPYEYLEDGSGNFVFLTDDGDYPSYTRFESDHQLVYVSDQALAAIRSGAVIERA